MIAKFSLMCPLHGAMATVSIEQPTEMKFKCGICGGMLHYLFDKDTTGVLTNVVTNVVAGAPKLQGVACAIEDHGCQE